MGMSKRSVAGMAGTTLMAALGMVSLAAADSSKPPSEAQVDTAAATSDLMVNTLVAALVQEIGETVPDNAAQGSASISLIFDDANKAMRLVGTDGPLRDNDVPQDAFESTALSQALIGVPYASVERDQGSWYYRRSVPLSNFASQCSVCHQNFGPVDASQWVGALMLRVPIRD